MARRSWMLVSAALAVVALLAFALILWPRPEPGDITGSVAPRKGGKQAMARLETASFNALPGWAGDDHAAALGAFLRSCQKLRAGANGWAGWRALCARAAETGPRGARSFFETGFRPYQVALADGGRGFLTSYYEPETDGSRTPDTRFRVPIYRRPPDLVTLKPGDGRGGLPKDHVAGRRTANGGLEPYPARADIERGALKGRGLELVWLDDPVEAFFIHVQGSSRVRLADGSLMRLAFDGKNGHPYTSIARVLIEREKIPKEQMTADRLRAWLNDNPGRASELMWHNRSFIFFREAEIADPALGPIGAQGVNLTAGRSLAVDRSFHELGLPFYIGAELPDGKGGLEPFRRLMIAQDTGSAILGAARGDIFWGSGDAAGYRAGLVRHAGDFFVLLPQGYPLPAWAGRPGA